jgi:phosphohistidine swiveling domain-containing protein
MSKASNLRRLEVAGFRVPAFIVLPSSLLTSFLATLSAEVLSAPRQTAQSIVDTPLPAPLGRQILQAVRQLPHPSARLAVRSSLAGEDSARHSFAGQLDSFLNVSGNEAILSAVKACWASAYADRALAYRRQHGLPLEPVVMEVVIQEMAAAQISGVIFTVDAAARDPRWMLISVAEGLGEPLVQGQVAGESYRVNRESGEVVGPGRLLAPVHITQLVSTAKAIEALFGEPQDIEFAIAGNELFLLQARPITTLVPTEHILWDNSNITESYSGVTTPLTFSVIRGAYAQVYRQFLELLGVRRIDEAMLRNLLGFYRGQVYYQLLNWYAALALLPAFEYNRRFMEQMMGVKQSAGQKTVQRKGGSLHLLALLVRLFVLHSRSEHWVKGFLGRFNAVLAEYQAKAFTALSPHAICAAYRDLEVRVLGNWRAPILTDFLAMIFFGVLRYLDERWLDPHGQLHNDLLIGTGEIESLEPIRQIDALAQRARADSAVSAIFTLHDPEAIIARLQSQTECAAFRAQLDGYLRRYGDRCMNELKLEEPNLRDEPARLIRLISAAVDRQAATPLAEDPALLPKQTQARTQLSALRWPQRWLFGWVLKHTRRHIRNRENMRFARTRLFGLLRNLFNALGQQWAATGALDRPEDIYYLTVQEIWDFVEGAATTLNLRGLANLRRAEYGRYQEGKALPDRFETFGVPYLDLPRDLLAGATGGEGTLRGVGCCSGKVTSRARVVESVNSVTDLDGDILVAERTDPGWVFLFPSAAGILVERGSPLSHSAIVAREMGKPIIVNILGLTARLATGDRVEMDGGTGVVQVWK